MKDSIGANPINFETEFYKQNNRLFLKESKNIKISKELIDKLNEYNIIDSTYFKLKSGELSRDQIPVSLAASDYNFAG
ncbi:hypothetical protein [Patiriisocius sp. Uisw_017]|uniref:hypothetical protein n=1 Tax=Patiriisocius sp. Uisw_017 TaxID=3230968 RepID=UPI0039E94B75